MKKMFSVSLALLLLVASTTTVLAKEKDQKDKGKNAPEVPFALLYPAAGLASYGIFRFTTSLNKGKS